jgi:hypothetical protein
MSDSRGLIHLCAAFGLLAGCSGQQAAGATNSPDATAEAAFTEYPGGPCVDGTFPSSEFCRDQSCGMPYKAECINGQWECGALYTECGVCSGQSPEAIEAHRTCSCSPVCDANGWRCRCGDAGGAHDAALDVGSIPFNFPCGPAGADGGTLLCFFPSQFCEESAGGPPPPPDSGPSVGYACKAFPLACQSNPTCGCLMANPSFCSGVGGGQLVGCAENGGAPTLQCAYP